ncbi:MAG: DUF4125 family protein [Bifidobacteriaceae bacterium]|jgi:hypothetical protein|nr:DUF4125 family protein [Bifidobacteriaceae bacterium]
MTEAQDLTKLVETIVMTEWDQFQEVNNEGGPANCQGNWPTFFQMRASQFMTWNRVTLESYHADLERANESGRNLLTEKYGLMMASTDPEYFQQNLAAYMPKINEIRTEQQERIITLQVAWAYDFRDRFPKLGQAMRVLRTSEDTAETTSFETYLRAEMSTYSQTTLDHYQALILEDRAQGINITEQTILNTVHLGGFATLDEAEAAQ